MKVIKNYASIENEILKYIEKKHNTNLNKYDLANISFTTISMDSLDVAELILFIEEKYNIDLNDKEIYHIKNIRDFIDYIYEKLK